MLRENPDRLWEIIYKYIIEILSVMCPFKNICVREEKTNDIYECIKKRAQYVRLFRKTGKDDIFNISKYFRNRCNRLIREAKSKYIKESILLNRNNPKKFWRTLNSILRNQASSNINFDFVNPETKENVSHEAMPDFLNAFYAKVGKRKSQDTGSFPDKYVLGVPCKIGDITIEEIVKLIREVDTNKDRCVDGIPTFILKSAFSKKPSAILHFFKKSLQYGIFPRSWATGYINILPKGGDKTNPSNWRPITQTCVPAKMLEKIVQNRLVSFLNEQDVLDTKQFGFRKGYSTQKAIFELLCDMHVSLNADNIMGLLFLDISKAFDSLDHSFIKEIKTYKFGRK